MKIRPFTLCTFDRLILVLIILHLIPLWAFAFIPTQDGPSHIENAFILSQYTNPAYNFQKIYDLRLVPFPNWLSHISLAALMRIFPPLVSEKIFLSLYIIGFPLAFIYFLGVINPAKKPLGLFSFVFIYNYLFLMGFYNFVFSIPLAFLALGYFWKYRQRLALGNAAVLNLLLLLVYFSHLVTYLVILVSIAFIALLQFAGQWLNPPTTRRGGPGTCLAISLAALLPTLPLLVSYYLGSNFANQSLRIDFEHLFELLKDFISLNILVSYERFGQESISLAIAALFGILFAITLVKRISHIGVSLWAALQFEDCLLGLFFIQMALYLAMPWDFGSGGWLNDRLALLGSLFLLAWFDITLPILPPKATPAVVIHRTWFTMVYPPIVTGLCLLAVLTMLGGVTASFARWVPVLQEYSSGSEWVKPNTVLLPLLFRAGPEDIDRVNPLLHASHYYTIGKGGINLGNYEPFVDYFPVRFKPGLNLPIYTSNPDWNRTLELHLHTLNLCHYARMVDTLLVWNRPNTLFKIDIDRCYTLVYKKGHLKIYVPSDDGLKVSDDAKTSE